MINSEPKKFKSKEEIKTFLESVAKKMGIKRDELADKLLISTSAFYGYITRREIPQKSYRKLLEMLNGEFQESVESNDTKAPNVSLVSIPLDDLLAEVERRGWLVELKRNTNTTGQKN